MGTDEFKKNCLYVPIAPPPEELDIDDQEEALRISKSPNTNPYWSGDTVDTWSSNGDGLYTWSEVENSDWNRWGIVEYKGDKRLLILDIDLYKMDEETKESIDIPIDTRLHSSQSGGFHVFYLIDESELKPYYDDGDLKHKLPVKLKDKIDDKLNGYVLSPMCEGYKVEQNIFPKEITIDEIPKEWLKDDSTKDYSNNTTISEISDEELKDRLELAKSMDDKFKNLFEGYIRAAGYDPDDRSKAEYVLADKIGYWFGRDESTIRELMDRSAAPKWHEEDRESYKGSVIRDALSGDTWEKDTDKWKCLSCRNTFRYKKGKKPKKCYKIQGGCGKDGNFEALTGIYQYFDFEGRTQFISEYLSNDILNEFDIITTEKSETIYLYEEGIYKDGKKSFLKSIAQNKLGKETKNQRIKETIGYIKRSTYKPIDELGIDGNNIVVQNGVLNLDKLELRDYDPEDHALNKLKVEYKADASCPTFKEYLKQWIPDKVDRRRLQEVLGTSLINDKLHKKAIILLGETDSGKSTLLEVIKSIYGKENLSNQSINSISNTRWGTSKLLGKMLNADDESKAGKLKNLAKLKRVFDGNTVEAEFKKKTKFEFTPYCEHIYCANRTPSAERSDDSFWNRWIPIVFPKKIPEQKQDPDLADRLIEEKEGILNWVIEGFKRFQNNGNKFTDRITWGKAREKWLAYGSSIQRFIQKCVKKDEGNKITTSELHDKYVDFTEQLDIDLDIEGQGELTKEVKKLNYAKYGTDYMIDGERGKAGFKNICVEYNKDQELDNIEDKIKVAISELYNGDSGVHIDDIIDYVDDSKEAIESKIKELREDGIIEVVGLLNEYKPNY